MEIMAHYLVQGPGQPGDLGAVGCSFPLQMKTCHFDFEKKKKTTYESLPLLVVWLGALRVF